MNIDGQAVVKWRRRIGRALRIGQMTLAVLALIALSPFGIVLIIIGLSLYFTVQACGKLKRFCGECIQESLSTEIHNPIHE